MSDRAGLRDRLLALRDRLLSDPAVLARAGDTLLGRLIARREARALFDLSAGFVYSQTLYAAVDLGLLTQLSGGPQTCQALARTLALPERSMQALLHAAEPLRLVERRGRERWGLGRRGAAVLGNPGLLAMVRHHPLLYADLADPAELLRRQRGERMAAFWPYSAGAPDADGAAQPAGPGVRDVAQYSALMAASQAFVAREVAAAYPFTRHRTLVDVGGGEGIFAEHVASHVPRLQATVFDLPPVAERARRRFADAGLDRLTAVGGDFFRDALPPADVVTLVRIVHDHDDAAAQQLLDHVARSMASGATLVLAEPMAGHPAAPGIAPYFALYLLAMGSGRPRRPDELKAMLRAAGFDRVRRLRERNPTATRVIIARR